MASSFAVVGDALLDVRVTTLGPTRHGSDVPAEVHLRPGGQGSNLAVRLARRGLEVSLACGIAGLTALLTIGVVWWLGVGFMALGTLMAVIALVLFVTAARTARRLS